MVTCGTYLKEHHFRSPERLEVVHNLLLDLAGDFGWNLEAWSVFSNHYHFISASDDPATLIPFITKLHTDTAIWVNKLDGTPGRQVWYNYWDTHLTFLPSYLARLNYVHNNAVHLRLVLTPTEYRWCSAAWFERTASPAFQRVLASLKIDRINVFDEFEVR